MDWKIFGKEVYFDYHDMEFPLKLPPIQCDFL